ncbi:peroxisome- protein [Ascosphaera acerosa]|nr:peroxisome- protein [Ascosphaera acerosa]
MVGSGIHETPPTDGSGADTIAAFSPANIAGSSLASRQRSTVIVHRKSPLLVATPPPVTRALAYAHPYLAPLTWLLSLLTWTSPSAWESYLLVAGFWGVVLHGDFLILWAGPLLVASGLVWALNNTAKQSQHRRLQSGPEQTPGKKATPDSVQHKSLDEIVDTLRDFTTKCNILFEPWFEMLEFINAQQAATASAARPAITILLTRILCATPVWFLLGLQPCHIVTTQRVVLVLGTILLTWHSRPARVTRVLLWRSLVLRQLCSFITGLAFDGSADSTGNPSAVVASSTPKSGQPPISFAARRTPLSPGVQFTFILYENQRRWLGLGWTSTLFSHERAPWTDEHLNPAPSKDDFVLPDVTTDNATWRWVAGSEWTVEVDDSKRTSNSKSEKNEGLETRTDADGWMYYDNKWHDFRGGEDGWSRYTRRRKWCRNAELVEAVLQDAQDLSGSKQDTQHTKAVPEQAP